MGKKRKKILIIDDEVDFGFLMRKFFMPRNFDVYYSLNLAEGMQSLTEHNPDYILLDNNLPDGFGWEKTEFILLNYPLSQLYLISALNTPKASTPNFRILEKPIEWAILKEIFDDDIKTEAI